MKCPQCGYDTPSRAAYKRYKEAVARRLNEYGYYNLQIATLFFACIKIRRRLRKHYEIKAEIGGLMSEEMADRGIAKLDVILPRKEKS